MRAYMHGYVFYTDGTSKPVISVIPEDREPDDYIDEVRETWSNCMDEYKLQGFLIGVMLSNDTDN